MKVFVILSRSVSRKFRFSRPFLVEMFLIFINDDIIFKEEYGIMSSKTKEYKTPDEILDLLKSRNLNISSPVRAKRILSENNYFFIKGYKSIFLNNNVEVIKYKDGVDFEDLYRLYNFDKDVKVLLFRYLLDIEQKIKATLSNYISDKYGVKDSQYLRRSNYNLDCSYLDKVLKKIKDQRKTYGKKNDAVKYYKDKYNYIPLWVLTKALTMGAIRDLYNIMKPDDQDRIAQNILEKDIPKKRVATLKNMIALLVDVRNMCAHDEMLINFEHKRIYLAMPELNNFKLKRNSKNNIIQGTKDLFTVLISIKYLTNRTTYNQFIQNLESKISKFVSKTKCITDKELLDYMHLPINYYELKQL